MTRPLGIVGCGLIGAKRAAAAAPWFEVVAVHDVDTRSAERLAEQHHRAEVMGDAKAVTDAVGPGGLVVVATTHDALATLGLAVVTAGCHLLLEKPGARRAAELRPVEEAAARHGVIARVGFNHRFHPAILEARRLLMGYAEPVLLVRARYGHGGRPGYEREWRADPARSGGGELLDQGVHLLDLVGFLCGQCRLLYGHTSTLFWPMPVEDNAFVHLGLAGGGEAWLHASWTEWKNLFSFEISTATRKIEVQGLGGSYGPERCVTYEMPQTIGPPLIRRTEWPPGDDSWAAEMTDVAAAIDGQPSVGADVRSTMDILSLVEEVYSR